MNLSKIIDYKYYKILCGLYFIILLILFNTNILYYIFGSNINKSQIKLFRISVLIFGLVFCILLPIIKIKLFNLSVKKKLNKEKLYDLFHNIKINKNIKQILHKINEIIPFLCIFSYIYLCINSNNINAISYFFIGISFIFIIKCVLSFSTILPDSSQKCQLKLLNGGCNELLCSGHFSVVFLIYLLVIKYKLVDKNIDILLLPLVILYGFIPIITEKHYTIDILVAIICVLLVNNYIPKN
jgi:cytochrome bd-type quinol oxidase subunit 2